MTIKEYIDTAKPIIINDIKFILYDVNLNVHENDINDEFEYDGETLEFLSFIDRLNLTINDLTELINELETPEKIKEYFIKNTENGNHCYWDGMYFIDNTYSNESGFLLGIRMD